MTRTLTSQFCVWQVANGFKVTPAPSFMRGEAWSTAEEYVFPTWAEASKWLGDQFRRPQEEQS
jgi:hypothetical protein